MIRRDGSASQRTEANLPRRSQPLEAGDSMHRDELPMRQCMRSVAWLTTGRLDGVVCGLGTPAWISARATGSCRDQRCHSSDKGGESRWSEGHQEGGCADAA